MLAAATPAQCGVDAAVVVVVATGKSAVAAAAVVKLFFSRLPVCARFRISLSRGQLLDGRDLLGLPRLQECMRG